MAQTVLITLTLAGADTGPFNLYSDADGYSVPFETGVSKASLLAGYTSVLVPNAATIIRVKSTSVLCDNYINLPIGGLTTTTTTTTVTPTTTTTTTGTPTTTTTTTTGTPTTTTTTTGTPTTTTTTTTETPTTTTTTTDTPTTTTTTTTDTPTTTTTTTDTPTTTTTTTEAPETITIDVCGAQQADGSGNVVVYAYASGPVDTNVSVNVTWIAADLSVLGGPITILSGEACGTVTLVGADPSETGANITIGTITPGSFGNQTYVAGSGTLSSSCTTCPIP